MSVFPKLIQWCDAPIDASCLGGKGANLLCLTRQGLPVPPWYCVPEQWFTTLTNIQVFDWSDEVLADGATLDAYVQEVYERLQDETALAQLGKQLEDILSGRDSCYYAVRSSANLEDAWDHSFAGLFDTFLYVRPDQLVDHVLACWRSALHLNVLTYLKKNNIPLHQLSVAVVIQEMVDSEQAGVLFQANPAGRLEEQVVVAGYGLGEGIVSDLVETDTYYCNRMTSQVIFDVSEKYHAMRFDMSRGTGVQRVAVAAEQRNARVLSDAQLDRLLALSKQVSALYDRPQDIEWAFDASGQVYLLQSRAITTLPEGDIALYDNSNVTESYPGMALPLTASLVTKIYQRLFYEAFAQNGGDRALLAKAKYRSAFESMVACIEGRIYYNLSSWYKVMSLLPFASQVFIPALEDAIGTRRSDVERSSGLRVAVQKARFLLALVHRYLVLPRLIERHDRAFKRLYQRTQSELHVRKGLTAIRDLFRQFFDEVFPIDQLGRISDTYLTVFLSLLNKQLVGLGLGNDQASSLINGLLAGQDDLDSVLPVKSIREMAHQVAVNPMLAKAFRDHHDWSSLSVALMRVQPEFLAQLNEHVALYGDRTIGELKFETVTFRQNPMLLAQLVINYADHVAGHEYDDQALKHDAEKQLTQLTQGRWWVRWKTRYLLNKVRELIKNREKFRFNRSRYYGLMRQMILAMAQQRVADGALSQTEDVFYLTDDELFEYPERLSASDIASLNRAIQERKEQWHGYANRRPESRMWLKGEIKQNIIPQQRVEGDDADAQLRGVGCCPGVVEAEAIVLKEPSPDAQVNGKILVAENTDPGWVFLIMAASGLVVEKGSLLSHTAIIGRELGVPTVVGVKRATDRIPNGSVLRVDGGSGEIKMNVIGSTENNLKENAHGLS